MRTHIFTTFIILLSINLAVSKSNMENYVPTCNYSYLNKCNITPTPQNVNILGGAAAYAVLAYATTTNSGPTTIVGSVGVCPGTAIAGFPLTIISGTIHSADQNALDGQNSVTRAYVFVAAMAYDSDITGTELAGLTLKPGCYKFSSSAFLSAGVLTLDANGNADAEWFFQIGSTLITSSAGSEVKVINGGSPLNVYWQVGSSATLKTSTKMVGNIMAKASITFGTNASLIGRAFACNGAITMLSNNISCALCHYN